MTISEIKERLVNLGINEGTLGGRGKKELGELLESLETSTNLQGQTPREYLESTKVNTEVGFEVTPENVEAFNKIEVKPRPRYQDPEWHDFVMSQFVPEELDPKGNPKVDGLRRVCEGLLGEIIESRPIQSTATMGLSAVNWILSIAWAVDNPSIDIESGLPRRTFGAFADACPENCKPPYGNFLSSMADTRAEAKALRRALRLRCMAAEEAVLGEPNAFEEKVSDGSYKGEDPINDTQKALIFSMCDRNGIDQDKLSMKICGKTLITITKGEASSIIVQLNKYQTKVKEQSEEIPDDIRKIS